MRQVLALEVFLLHRHHKLALAFVGLLFVPAIYALIYLWAVWDPASHTRDLPAALVNLDTGARYRERDLNLGTEVLTAIEQHGQFNYRRYADAGLARRDVRAGRLAFVLEVPPDFSRQAMPGERAGAAKLTIYTSEGNNYSSAGFARRLAPEVAQRVNTLLSEARWELVLSSAAGSQRSLDSLRQSLTQIGQGAHELQLGLAKAREGHATLAKGTVTAADASARVRAGAGQLADTAPGMAQGLRQLRPTLKQLEARRGGDAEAQALRQGTRQAHEGMQELGRGLDALAAGSRQLEGGMRQFKAEIGELPLLGGRLAQGLVPLEQGMEKLAEGLEDARDGGQRLSAGLARVDDGVGQMTEANQRAVAALGQAASRLPDDARLDSFVEGTRELSRGAEGLAGGLRQLQQGHEPLATGLARLGEGAARLDSALELVRGSLPEAVQGPGGSAQGLALSVQPVIEVVAPVPNNGTALAPNFVPLALWVGAVMAAFLVHWRRIPAPVSGAPRTAQVVGKLLMPAVAAMLQAVIMWGMLSIVLQVNAPQPALFVLTLVTASLTFLLLVFALVRLLGDLGKVAAVLLLIVQVSAAGAVLPIELSDAAFQALHPYLPLTWVVQAFRVSLFGAFDGEFWPAYGVVVAFGVGALIVGTLAGRWRVVPLSEWRPPLDIE